MTTPVATQLITRAKLSADYRIRKAYGGELAGTYAHARNAAPQGVLLDKGADIQAEASYVGLKFVIVRHFVQIEVPWSTYRPGQIITLEYPRYGLDSVQAMIVGRQRNLTTRRIRLTLWY